MQSKLQSKNDGLWLFFLLTFAFSWLLTWIPAALTGQTSMQFPTALLFLLGGFGPSIVGVILTYRFSTPEQRKDFWRRVVDFKRIRPGWAALILLASPLTLALSVCLSLALGGELPGMAQGKQLLQQPVMLIPLVIIGLVAGPFSEELGWRGFALDRMVQRWGFNRATLLLGVIWWVWHLPLFFIRGTTHYTWGWGTPFFWLFLVNIFPLVFLISWAYVENNRSILAAVLFHFMVNFTLSLFFPLSLQIQIFQTAFLSLLVAGMLLQRRQMAVRLAVS